MKTKAPYAVALVSLPVLCLLLLALSKGHAHSGGTYQYGAEACTLKGVLVHIVSYGPPGYGETPEMDKKEWAFGLELKHPIDVVADGSDRVNVTHRGVKLVQLDAEKIIDSGEYLHRLVLVKGHLTSPVALHRHADVLMKVDEIELVPTF